MAHCTGMSNGHPEMEPGPALEGEPVPVRLCARPLQVVEKRPGGHDPDRLHAAQVEQVRVPADDPWHGGLHSAGDKLRVVRVTHRLGRRGVDQNGLEERKDLFLQQTSDVVRDRPRSEGGRSPRYR